MKILYFLILYSLISVFAQIKNTNYLSSFEIEVVHEINVARKHPQKYATYINQLKAYYVGKLIKRPGKPIIKTKEGISAAEEAVRFLRFVKSQPSLKPSKGMSLGARDHVEEQGPTGSTGHESRDGNLVWDRVNKYGKWKKTIGENISYGRDNARDIVLGLIIDDGILNRGHRKNIFNPRYAVVGVAYGYHAVYGNMCVITFAGGFEEKWK